MGAKPVSLRIKSASVNGVIEALVVAEFSVFSGTRQHSVGGVVTEFFSYLQLRNLVFTPHRAIFVGRDTHFGLDTAKIRISC